MSKTSDVSGARAESFRVPIDCVVDLRSGSSGEWKRRSASNISMSGLFIRTAEMHPKGSTLELKFELQNGQPAIRTQAEVLWSRLRDTGPETPQGLGLRFLNLDLESKYAISRLVERYQQLGRTPFHLASEDELSTPRRAPWSQRSALILAFLAGAVAGAAGSFWLVARSDPGVETAGVVRTSEQAPKTAPHPPGAERSTEAQASKEAAPVGDDTGIGIATPAGDPTTAIETAIDTWARAWAAGDIDGYLAAYSTDFQPASGRSLDAWQAMRRERLARPGAVELSISALEVEVLDPSHAIAHFDQAYATPGYRDRVRKQLELIKGDEAWKIISEESQADLPIE